MTQQLLIGAVAIAATLVPGYFLGTWLRGRVRWYRPAFIGILVGGSAVLSLGFYRDDMTLIALCLGAIVGLINGTRHGFRRPFEGLSGHMPEDADRR
jgi:hypothetical protein